MGPDPFTLILAGLVGCTLTTLRMYVHRKGWNADTDAREESSDGQRGRDAARSSPTHLVESLKHG